MQMTAHSWLAAPRYLASLDCLARAFVASRHGAARPKLLFVVLMFCGFLSWQCLFGVPVSTIVKYGSLQQRGCSRKV
ncbi:hypothetical protein, partial [Salmonella enterica]|uniref:hypothetical protein n=1 Tax=Salmonella enterica TaxID=28901 RepID=UPI000DD39C65